MTSILYVDDDGQMLRPLVEMFGGEFDVRTTDDTDEALRLLDERPADIRISDQRMPKMEGTQFLRRVSERHPLSFRMLVTGHATVAGTLSELSSGVVQQFIPKPWDQAAMREALTRAQMAVRGRDD